MPNTFTQSFKGGGTTLINMSKIIALIVFVVAVGINDALASDEIKQALLKAYQPVITECSQEYGVTEDQIKAAKEAKNPDAVNSCFVGCLLKKTDVINSEGKFDPAIVVSKLKEFVKDEEHITKIESVANQCASVNDETTGDGAAGCDRAKLLMTCLLKNKDQLPL